MTHVPAPLRPLCWWVRLLVDPTLAGSYRWAGIKSRVSAAWFAAGGLHPGDVRDIRDSVGTEPAIGITGTIYPTGQDRSPIEFAAALRGQDRATIEFGTHLLGLRARVQRPAMASSELPLFLGLSPDLRETALFYAARDITTVEAFSATISGLPTSLAHRWVEMGAFYDLGHLVSGHPERITLSVLIEAWIGGALREALATQGDPCDYTDVGECARRLHAWLDVPEVAREMRGADSGDPLLDRIVDWTGVPTPWAWFGAGYAPEEAADMAASHPDSANVLAAMSALRHPCSKTR